MKPHPQSLCNFTFFLKDLMKLRIGPLSLPNSVYFLDSPPLFACHIADPHPLFIHSLSSPQALSLTFTISDLTLSFFLAQTLILPLTYTHAPIHTPTPLTTSPPPTTSHGLSLTFPSLYETHRN